MCGDRCRGSRTRDGSRAGAGWAAVLVLERASTTGFETSSRNNEVIHVGLYYKAGSLKARCCVVGRERLYLYCREHGILHAQIAGIGPKASGPKEPAVDFVVQGPEIHGVPGLVNRYGIESPDLTGFMPLAEQVLRRLTRSAAE